ncbi:MAG: tRNA pseudouridine(38-40) synthase TruA [Planctomycetaceae bacterium]|nr:tRNA pseudouridine(38-40) synthase TruA [Planctomycetaceae bacterium]
MRVLKMTVSYDGTDFCGWQFQPGKRSVQETVESAILAVTGDDVRTVASGRTDAGVHAIGQVVSAPSETNLDDKTLCRALNARLPYDVRIGKVEFAETAFHPIRDAKSKRYRYVIQCGGQPNVFQRRFCWHLHQTLDVVEMQQAANRLIGQIDFASFQAAGAPRKSTVRTVFELDLVEQQVENESFVTFEIEANGFLYNMVRIIVGTLVQVGLGKQTTAWMEEVVQGCDRRLAGPTSPPQGLFLLFVRY